MGQDSRQYTEHTYGHNADTAADERAPTCLIQKNKQNEEEGRRSGHPIKQWRTNQCNQTSPHRIGYPANVPSGQHHKNQRPHTAQQGILVEQKNPQQGSGQEYWFQPTRRADIS